MHSTADLWDRLSAVHDQLTPPLEIVSVASDITATPSPLERPFTCSPVANTSS